MTAENPYQPPSSSIDKEPVALPTRPLLLKVGIGILTFEMIGSFLWTLTHIWYLKQIRPGEDHSHTLVGTIGLLVFEAPLLWLLIRGTNWVRYVVALLLFLGVFDYASRTSLDQLRTESVFKLASDWGSNCLMIAGVALLFAPTVSKWFRGVR